MEHRVPARHFDGRPGTSTGVTASLKSQGVRAYQVGRKGCACVCVSVCAWIFSNLLCRGSREGENEVFKGEPSERGPYFEAFRRKATLFKKAPQGLS